MEFNFSSMCSLNANDSLNNVSPVFFQNAPEREPGILLLFTLCLL